MDEYAVNKFLSQIFSDDSNSHGKVCSLVKECASQKFDMKEEVLPSTMLHELAIFSIKRNNNYEIKIYNSFKTCVLRFGLG